MYCMVNSYVNNIAIGMTEKIPQEDLETKDMHMSSIKMVWSVQSVPTAMINIKDLKSRFLAMQNLQQ